jgi:hypothetical protein
VTTPLTVVMADLDRATNMFGAIGPEPRARLYRLIDDPTLQTWQEARSIVVTTTDSIGGRTLWQALLAYTDYSDGVPTTTQVTDALAVATR